MCYNSSDQGDLLSGTICQSPSGTESDEVTRIGDGVEWLRTIVRWDQNSPYSKITAKCWCFKPKIELYDAVLIYNVLRIVKKNHTFSRAKLRGGWALVKKRGQRSAPILPLPLNKQTSKQTNWNIKKNYLYRCLVSFSRSSSNSLHFQCCVIAFSSFLYFPTSTLFSLSTALNWQKWIIRFLTCPDHRI